MGARKIHKVLSTGSQIEVIGGEHLHRQGSVLSVIGGPREHRLVVARLSGVAGSVQLEQHQIKVLHSPQGWKPGMQPVYQPHEVPAPPEPEPEPKALKAPKPKGPSGAGKPRRRKRGHHRKRYAGGIAIPPAPGNHADKRRSK